MDPTQMAERCPTSRAVGRAVLAGYGLRLSSHGHATIVPEPDAETWGVLWRITPADELTLDFYESVNSGLYRRAELVVGLPGDGDGDNGAGPEEIRALVYISDDRGPGRPSEGYFDGLMAGAQAFGLPASYAELLAALDPGD